jgi:quinol monooxygenase YgiN
MIVVVGRVQTDPQRREECVRVGQAVARASRAEAGCLAYAVHADTEDPNRVVFVEEWESQEALDAHFATEHVATFMAAIQATLAAPPEVRFHTVSATADLADVTSSA